MLVTRSQNQGKLAISENYLQEDMPMLFSPSMCPSAVPIPVIMSIICTYKVRENASNRWKTIYKKTCPCSCLLPRALRRCQSLVQIIFWIMWWSMFLCLKIISRYSFLAINYISLPHQWVATSLWFALHTVGKIHVKKRGSWSVLISRQLKE
jgi:hypothetical protein